MFAYLCPAGTCDFCCRKGEEKERPMSQSVWEGKWLCVLLISGFMFTSQFLLLCLDFGIVSSFLRLIKHFSRLIQVRLYLICTCYLTNHTRNVTVTWKSESTVISATLSRLFLNVLCDNVNIVLLIRKHDRTYLRGSLAPCNAAIEKILFFRDNVASTLYAINSYRYDSVLRDFNLYLMWVKCKYFLQIRSSSQARLMAATSVECFRQRKEKTFSIRLEASWLDKRQKDKKYKFKSLELCRKSQRRRRFVVHQNPWRHILDNTRRYLMPCEPLPGDFGPNENTDEGELGRRGDGLSPLEKIVWLLPQGANSKLWSSLRFGDSTSILVIVSPSLWSWHKVNLYPVKVHDWGHTNLINLTASSAISAPFCSTPICFHFFTTPGLG